MSRKGKGNLINKFIEDYTVIDIETTGFLQPIEIIEISALKVRSGEVVDEFNTLVHPHSHIPERITAINNITDKMVENAPELSDILEDFLLFVGNDVIMGYNNNSYDMPILYDSIFQLTGKEFSNDILDVYYQAQRFLCELPNHKLSTISKYYGLDTTNEHRALADCYLTKQCYDHIKNGDKNTSFCYDDIKDNNDSKNLFRTHITDKTKALREMESIIQDIIEDGVVTKEEFLWMYNWLENHIELREESPFNKVFDEFDKILCDGIVTTEELEELHDFLTSVLNPVSDSYCNSNIESLVGKHVCITGEFQFGDRPTVTAYLESKGIIIDNTIKKSTDYLVVGFYGSDSWIAGNYGGKIKKAMEYVEKGCPIKIVKEQDFVNSLKCDCNESKRITETTKSDQISFLSETTDTPNWCSYIDRLLDSLNQENNLPEKSLRLYPNYSRDKEKITSYSISIYESEYPVSSTKKMDDTRNSVLLRISERKDSLEFQLNKNIFESAKYPKILNTKQLESDPINVTVIFKEYSEETTDFIRHHIIHALNNYTSKSATFGCCGLFKECSKAKRCIHVNQLYSKACMYRKNLESGKVFY